MKEIWGQWRKLGSIGGGGQASTWLAEDAQHPELGATFVLKLLHNQQDPERRKRMHREVAALQILDHLGIPKFIGSNAERFATDEPLFLVTEFIPGVTIDDAISNQPLSLGSAVQTTLRLLDIVEYCHSREVVHRDIKPANAIFRNGNSHDPVLLDFGLSFNQETLNESDTETEQEIGNRFLWLPELRHPGANKRDACSDITAVCGLFLYLFTGRRPVSLLDEKRRKPHQRDEARQVIEAIAAEKRALLNRIFDVGFEHEVHRRWQTVEGLRNELIALQAAKPTEHQSSNLNELLSTLRSSESYNNQAQLVRILENTSNVLMNAHGRFHGEIAAEFVNSSSGFYLDKTNLTWTYTMGFVNRNTPAQIQPKFEAVITGSELVVAAGEEGDGTYRKELLRVPIEGFNDWKTLAERARGYWLAGIARVVQKISG